LIAVENLQEPLKDVLNSAKQALTPIVTHPSTFAKMARFYAGVHELEYENDEYDAEVLVRTG
jgi:hypothetical protein